MVPTKLELAAIKFVRKIVQLVFETMEFPAGTALFQTDGIDRLLNWDVRCQGGPLHPLQHPFCSSLFRRDMDLSENGA